VWGRKNSAGPGLPATCSVGGEALTAVTGSLIDANISGDNTSFGARWFVGDVSVGGNQTIAFTFTADGGGGAAATMIRAGYAIYEGDGFSETPFDTVTDEATATNDRTLTGSIDSADGGAFLATGGISSTANIAATLTGIATEDADFQESSANNNIVFGHSNGLSSATGTTVQVVWAAGGTTDDAFWTVISLSLEVHDLTANSIASGTPTVGTPAIAQVHGLTADAIAADGPTVGTPALTVNAPAALIVGGGDSPRKRARRKRRYENELARHLQSALDGETIEEAQEVADSVDAFAIAQADLADLVARQAERRRLAVEALIERARLERETDEDDVEVLLLAS
jgi:hypothetical protein